MNLYAYPFMLLHFQAIGNPLVIKLFHSYSGHLFKGWKGHFRSDRERLLLYWASLVVQRVKRLPAMQETRVRSLGQEDPLEKEMATHSSILAWRSPWAEEPGGLQSTGSSALLGRTTPSLGWKKVQKKTTSAPIPKKYFEYEVSQWGVVKGDTLTETTHPDRHHSNHLHELFYNRRSC